MQFTQFFVLAENGVECLSNLHWTWLILRQNNNVYKSGAVKKCLDEAVEFINTYNYVSFAETTVNNVYKYIQGNLIKKCSVDVRTLGLINNIRVICCSFDAKTVKTSRLK